MNCLLLVTCFFAICVASLALVSNWNQEMRDYVLELHNDKRRKEGGCQINKLIYDMDLENQTRRWAEGCVYKHESLPGRGENLAWNSMEQPEKELILGGFTAWFDEKNLYSYGQDSCSMSCHYTQLVWDETQKVGCWSTRCLNLRNAYENAWWLVCFYTPMGNMIGVQPYQKSCTSPCREGQTEENGLCLDGITAESKQGKGNRDNNLLDKGDNQQDKGDNQHDKGDNKQDKGEHPGCVDNICLMYQKSGRCGTDVNVKSNCKKTCELCEVGEPCVDLYGCEKFKDKCESRKDIMGEYCPKTCNYCQK